MARGAQAIRLYYRIQPAGLSLLGHSSEDWAGEEMTGGRVCAYPGPNLVLSGYNDDWFDRDIDAGAEMIIFTGRDSEWLASSSAGVSVVPVEEVERLPLDEWLDQQKEWEW